MRIILPLLVLLFACPGRPAQAQSLARVQSSDFLKILGKWEGKLTYIDYTSHKPVTMPANVEIRQIGETTSFACFHSYPTEPNANSKDTLTIGNAGTMIDNEKVLSRTALPDGSIEIVTQEQATDGNDGKQALIKHTYTISPTLYRIRKEVLFSGEKEWLQRHEIVYTSHKK
ncbi:MAG: hypothetical protein U0264_02300 [Candidatus Kapaibacterium sp.]